MTALRVWGHVSVRLKTHGNVVDALSRVLDVYRASPFRGMMARQSLDCMRRHEIDFEFAACSSCGATLEECAKVMRDTFAALVGEDLPFCQMRIMCTSELETVE